MSGTALFVKTTPTSTILPPPPPPIEEVAWIPEGAICITPEKTGNKIYYLADNHRILKLGPRVRMAEAEAMRFVASRASIPVPHVYEAYEKEGIGYIFMSKVEGQTLVKVWKTLSEDDRAVVVNQLRGCVLPLRDLRGEFYGALWNRPCEDIFFHHLCIAKPEDQKYKHYKSRKEYNEGLVQAFHNSCPTGSLSNTDKNLAQDIITLDEECKIFSHGDFHLYNILVDESLSVTGIIDWQGAGFSINEWDYLEAMLIARNPAWIQASAEIFPKESQVHYKTFNAFNQALVAYSGF